MKHICKYNKYAAITYIHYIFFCICILWFRLSVLEL